MVGDGCTGGAAVGVSVGRSTGLVAGGYDAEVQLDVNRAKRLIKLNSKKDRDMAFHFLCRLIITTHSGRHFPTFR
jgi:hypothetical protein